MSVRELINRNSVVTTWVTIIVIVLAVGLGIYTQAGSGAPKPSSSAWYTTDDGATWFADDVHKITPFQKDGKEAVRVYVFQCGSGKPFGGYVERYTPAAMKQVEQLSLKSPERRSLGEAMQMQSLALTGVVVKKLGPNNPWTTRENRDQFVQITSIPCPAGSDPAIPVEP